MIKLDCNHIKIQCGDFINKIKYKFNNGNSIGSWSKGHDNEYKFNNGNSIGSWSKGHDNEYNLNNVVCIMYGKKEGMFISFEEYTESPEEERWFKDFEAFCFLYNVIILP